MKWALLPLVLLLAAGPACAVINNPGKIGVGTWDKDSQGTALNDVQKMNFGWHYNWSTTQLWAPSGTARTVPFVPMVWNQQMIGNSIPASGALLGFNEPDNCGQGGVCMSVATAITLWPQLQTMATSGRRIGSPATANDATQGWLADFMTQANSKGYRVDFIAVHYYSPVKGSQGVANFKAHLEAVYAKYNKPIWVTEWALVDWSKTQPSQTFAEAAAYANEALVMLDSLPFVEKHAYFSTYYYKYGTYGLNTELYDSSGNLTPVGQVFYNALHASPPADTTAPVVAISAPAAGAAVSGSAVTVSANASDNVGVAGVQFLLDGANLGAEDTTAPYGTSWNTTSATNAAHALSAVARDAAGNKTASAIISVTVSNTASDTTAPVISGISASNVTAGAATISWTTNEASNSQVEYGLSTSYGLASAINGTLATGHSMGLSGLSASTAYHYRVKSRDSAGNLATSGDYTFTTGAAAPAGTSFSDTFNSGAPTGWTPVSGTWSVSNGQYSQSNLALYRALTIAGSTWGDVSVQADINIVSGGQDLNQILLRYIDANNYVAAFISKYWGCIGLEQMQGGVRTYSQVALAPAYNTWYTMKAVATGGQAQVYLNGALKHTWTLPNGATQGKIGLGNSVSTALFDNVTASAGATSDTTPPAVSISAPAGGSTVSGSAVTVSASASDNVGVAGVQFKLDGVNLGAEDTVAPYSVSWNSTLASNAGHTLTAVARDAAGNKTTSAAISVTVNNSAGDTTAPTALIQSPAQGEIVGLTIKVTATGSDNVGVSRVELWGDGNLRATQSFAPAVPSFTTTLTWSARKGQRKLQVFTYDAAGNKGSSSLVTVTASRSGSQVYLVSSQDNGQSSEEEPRALMLSLQQSRGASLAFSEDVQDAAIVDLHGRSILHQSKQASPIVMKLQESSGGRLPMEAGLWLIEMKDSSGRRTVKPLLFVK